MLRQLLLLTLIIALLLGHPELYPNRLRSTLKNLILFIVFLTIIVQHPQLARTANWPALKELWHEHAN